MKPDELRFQPVQEARGWFFSEYRPPVGSLPFATLALTVVEPKGTDEIADAMEKEARYWVNRFPVPVFVSAFDDKDDSIDVESVRGCNHFVAFLGPDGHSLQLHWSLLPNDHLESERAHPHDCRGAPHISPSATRSADFAATFEPSG